MTSQNSKTKNLDEEIEKFLDEDEFSLRCLIIGKLNIDGRREIIEEIISDYCFLKRNNLKPINKKSRWGIVDENMTAEYTIGCYVEGYFNGDCNDINKFNFERR